MFRRSGHRHARMLRILHEDQRHIEVRCEQKIADESVVATAVRNELMAIFRLNKPAYSNLDSGLATITIAPTKLHVGRGLPHHVVRGTLENPLAVQFSA